MLKVLASVLLVAHVAMVTTPVLAARPASADADAPACAQVAAHGTDIGAVTEADCQGCDLPDCHALHGCAGAAPALANAVTVQLGLWFGSSDDAELIAHHVAGDRTPTSPPPRA